MAVELLGVRAAGAGRGLRCERWDNTSVAAVLGGWDVGACTTQAADGGVVTGVVVCMCNKALSAAVTVLALALFVTFPIGTAYALYALWVCWANPTTRRHLGEETTGPFAPPVRSLQLHVGR